MPRWLAFGRRRGVVFLGRWVGQGSLAQFTRFFPEGVVGLFSMVYMYW